VVEQTEDFLRMGVHYDSDLKSSLLLNLLYRNVGFEGSRLSLTVNLSENESYLADYTVFTNWQPGIALGLASFYNNLNVFLYDDVGRQQASLDFSVLGTDLTLSTIFSNVFVTGLSAQVRRSSVDYVFAPPDWVEDSYTLLNFMAFATLDTWDRTIYPTGGARVSFTSLLVTDLLDSAVDLYSVRGLRVPEDFLIHTLRVDGAVPVSDRLSLLYAAYGGTANNDRIPPDYRFYLGGSYPFQDTGFPFMGLKFLEVSGTHAWALQAGLQYEFIRNAVVQVRANAGKASDDIGMLFNREGTDAGVGLTVGWHSPIGRVEYTVSYSDRRDEPMSWVNIGYRF
jgi:NTE family protein